jgi:hypothetical protein
MGSNIKRWSMLEKRIRAEAKSTLRNNASDGVAIISVHLVTDAQGEPLVWVVQDGKRVEPSKDAAETIKALLGSLS